MTSGDNNFNYFPEKQVNNRPNLLQFKHSENIELVVWIACPTGEACRH